MGSSWLSPLPIFLFSLIHVFSFLCALNSLSRTQIYRIDSIQLNSALTDWLAAFRLPLYPSASFWSYLFSVCVCVSVYVRKSSAFHTPSKVEETNSFTHATQKTSFTTYTQPVSFEIFCSLFPLLIIKAAYYLSVLSFHSLCSAAFHSSTRSLGDHKPKRRRRANETARQKRRTVFKKEKTKK